MKPDDTVARMRELLHIIHMFSITSLPSACAVEEYEAAQLALPHLASALLDAYEQQQSQIDVT